MPLKLMPSGKLVSVMPPEPVSVTCSGLATTDPLKLSRPQESSWSEPFSWPVRLSSVPLGPKLASTDPLRSALGPTVSPPVKERSSGLP